MAWPESQNNWCKEDVVQLLEYMEDNLPPNGNHTFKTTQEQMDWGKVAFKGFSGEMCKRKWLEISYKLRKIRTLRELVLEAKECVKNSYKSKTHMKHPDLPKKPLTAYLRFFKENRLLYSQRHPQLRNHELTRVLTEKYKELPEEMKLKYVQDFQKEKQEFKEKLAQFRKDHPDLVQNAATTSVVPKRRPTRAQKKFQGNVTELTSSPDNCFSEWKFPGEPEKPPMNGYMKFHQDMWPSRQLRPLPLRERMVEIGRRWQRVPQSQKELYTQQAEELQRQYKVHLDLWLKSLSPEEYAAYRERTYGKRKNTNMSGGPHPKIIRTDVQSPPTGALQGGLAQEQGLQAPGTESSETVGGHSHVSQGPKEIQEDGESSSSSDSSSGEEDEEREVSI